MELFYYSAFYHPFCVLLPTILKSYRLEIKRLMLNVVSKTIDLGDGRSIKIETGKLAKQADGAVTVTH